ncbi:hypothetical protein GCM10009828_103460 [Actinoplanes couchii]|uniref:Copper resistance protein D domain-containing protein n=2 Tax=Actinoplanes couchii TaxID=403638 RepID=A0ABQ3XLK2_9ACTN|nr:hypothetical protein Aco03nite_077600 [Actinoplanes couchii]
MVAATAAVVLIPALMFAGGVDTTVIPGLPDAGPVTPWALPVVTTASDLLAILLAGVLVTAAFLLPGDGPSVSAHGWLLLRRATWLAAAWFCVVVARILFSVSDVLGVPVPELGLQPIAGFTLSISQGQALMWQAGLILVVALLSRAGLSRGLAAVAAILALAAIVPPAFTGHASGAGDHQLAVSSLVLHILAATLWIGGLGGLLLVRRVKAFPEAVARYSRLALVCFIVTAISGTANAAVRLGDSPSSSDRGTGYSYSPRSVPLLLPV